MRNKLLLSAAVAAAMSFGAMADTTPVVAPEKDVPVFAPHQANPEAPTVKADLTADDISALFNNKEADGVTDESDGRFNQEAIIFQEGGEDGRNNAIIDQTASTEGLASVEQRGSNNAADVLQENTGGPGSDGQFVNPANIAVVDQTGDGNTTTVRQFDGPSLANPLLEANIVSVHQYSSGTGLDVNTVDVEQNGGENVSVQVTQGSPETGGADNSAVVLQSGSANSDIDIAQSFDGNAADAIQIDTWRSTIAIEQNGVLGQIDANNAVVEQTAGEGLEANIVQGGEFDGGLDNDALIVQTGFENTTNISQIFDGNVASVDQGGASNQIDIEQGSGLFVGNANNADVIQSGWGNEIDVYQSAAGDDANSTIVTQDGESNDLIINQTAGFGGANISQAEQFGANNELNIIQVNDGNGLGGDNFVFALQDGEEGTVNISQDGSGNDVFATQGGWGNTLAVAQIGDSNFADVDQSGDSNELTIVQDGEFNEVTAVQAGYNNASFIDQEGSSNIAELTQETNGNSAHIFQTNYDSGFVDGGTNVASISQTFNSDQAALIVQFGAANTATISQ